MNEWPEMERRLYARIASLEASQQALRADVELLTQIIADHETGIPGGSVEAVQGYRARRARFFDLRARCVPGGTESAR